MSPITDYELSTWDRVVAWFSPRAGLDRARARLALTTIKRHYEAAQSGRRTSGWHRNYGDVNSVTARALVELRLHARDLARNNAWAARGLEVITGNTVGWGIVPKPSGENDSANAAAAEVWHAWAGSTDCDADGRSNFAAMQELSLRAIANDGEMLLRRRWRQSRDRLALPMQVQVLEADFLDTSKDGEIGIEGGPIVQGVEFDAIGRRVAYWLFPEHPGSQFASGLSKRVPASEIIHVYRSLRPGQVRGISWLAQTIAPLKDFDEYEDATLLRQKIAACFAAFVQDIDGLASPIGEVDASDPLVETFEPGMITRLKPGQTVTMANPPLVQTDGFDTRTLRRIAAGIGVTYEDLTGDYSQVNFSSARMSRLSHWANVYKWRWNMFIPLLCDGVWAWAMEAAQVAGKIGSEIPPAQWTAPGMPMIEPDKEGLALTRLVRTGALTPSEMILELGKDPDKHWPDYAADFKKLDELGIKLDSDVRAVSQAGLTQGGGGGEEKSASERAAEELALVYARRRLGEGKP